MTRCQSRFYLLGGDVGVKKTHMTVGNTVSLFTIICVCIDIGLIPNAWKKTAGDTFREYFYIHRNNRKSEGI